MSKTKRMLIIEDKIGEDIRDFLFRKYWEEDLTTHQIGELVGINSCTVSSWFKRLGITARDRSEASYLRFSTSTEEERKEITRKAHERIREVIDEGDFWFKGVYGESNNAKKPEARRKISEYKKKHNPMHVEEYAKKMRESMEEVLRGRATEHELKFKEGIEKSGYRPKFQHTVCKCILDFAFLDLKIGIEIDGNSHMFYEEARERDKRQEESLEREGWIILRFFNSEIENKLDECLQDVIEIVEANKRLYEQVKEAI